MPPTIVEIIDAVEADINALALPTHKTFKYAKARSLRVDQGKWLQVYPNNVSADVITTLSDYDDMVRVVVEWVVPAFAGVESNQEDQALALAHLANAQLIADRLRTYGGGVPGLVNTTATLETVTFDLAQGGVWEAVAHINVEVFE